MYVLDENENGKQLIERLEGQNATLLYSHGFDCGTMSYNQIDFSKDVVRMHSSTVQLNASGSPVGKPSIATRWRVDIPLSDCIDEGGSISMDVLKDLYIEGILGKQTPPAIDGIAGVE